MTDPPWVTENSDILWDMAKEGLPKPEDATLRWQFSQQSSSPLDPRTYAHSQQGLAKMMLWRSTQLRQQMQSTQVGAEKAQKSYQMNTRHKTISTAASILWLQGQQVTERTTAFKQHCHPVQDQAPECPVR